MSRGKFARAAIALAVTGAALLGIGALSPAMASYSCNSSVICLTEDAYYSNSGGIRYTNGDFYSYHGHNFQVSNRKLWDAVSSVQNFTGVNLRLCGHAGYSDCGNYGYTVWKGTAPGTLGGFNDQASSHYGF